MTFFPGTPITEPEYAAGSGSGSSALLPWTEEEASRVRLSVKRHPIGATSPVSLSAASSRCLCLLRFFPRFAFRGRGRDFLREAVALCRRCGLGDVPQPPEEEETPHPGVPNSPEKQ